MTNNLHRRLKEHRENAKLNNKTFTGKYKVHHLLYFEKFQYVNNAHKREKEIKKWRREKKLNLIYSKNPEMKFIDLMD
jgi:putative endonuclease